MPETAIIIDDEKNFSEPLGYFKVYEDRVEWEYDGPREEIIEYLETVENRAHYKNDPELLELSREYYKDAPELLGVGNEQLPNETYFRIILSGLRRTVEDMDEIAGILA